VILEQILRAPHVDGFYEANPLVWDRGTQDYRHIDPVVDVAAAQARFAAQMGGKPTPPPPAGVFFSGVFSDYAASLSCTHSHVRWSAPHLTSQLPLSFLI
jgi:hypothetical protein